MDGELLLGNDLKVTQFLDKLNLLAVEGAKADGLSVILLYALPRADGDIVDARA